MSWESVLCWYMAGCVGGLTIALFIVHDEVTGWIFLIISWGLIVAQLCILLWVILRSRHNEWR